MGMLATLAFILQRITPQALFGDKEMPATSFRKFD